VRDATTIDASPEPEGEGATRRGGAGVGAHAPTSSADWSRQPPEAARRHPHHRLPRPPLGEVRGSRHDDIPGRWRRGAAAAEASPLDPREGARTEEGRVVYLG
jgi:hypothetical protein